MTTGAIKYFGVEWRICANYADRGIVGGEVYGVCLKKPMPFSDLGLLILHLDEILDVRNFPQAFQSLRTFEKDLDAPPLSYAARTPEEEMDRQTVIDARGEVDTLSIHVISRRNATWQGQIAFPDSRLPQPFESTFEMFQILNRIFFP